MATANYPNSVSTLTDVPATQAEPRTHSDQHDLVNAEMVAVQTKLGTKQAFKGVERYATATARNNELTSPTAGMLAVTAGVLQKNKSGNTTSWEDIPTGANTIQSGVASGTTDANGYYTVTFGNAFSTSPVVIPILFLDQDRFVTVTARANNNFQVRYFDLSTGTFLPSASISLMWIALT